MKQQVALVTGSNRGIGFEIAKQLAMKKIQVVLTSRNSANGEASLKRLTRDDGGIKKVVSMQLDVSNQVSVDRILDEVEKTFGRLDILVNNAAILIDRDDVAASRADLEMVKTTLETNLIGAWRMCKAFIPLMKKNNYGRIVNVSSGAGEFEYMATSGGYWPAYSVSKASLNAFTVMLASELKGTNILVNAVCPGWVRTDMGGSNAPRSVEEGAATPVWLATLPDGGPTGHNFYDKKQISW
ncbi:MAG TPA: SDR family oxidoreductase [Nitrososphaera sp.]|jgi:NAD(P)-dependent dehydrogenase (short-subunit alcohol dehydrogenase family)|nr:SDR family oxidoreductase [Nitrososphaera sp.]